MSVKQNFSTIKPTLNLDFANSKAVDSRITFTRASAATVTNAQGSLQTVRNNKPRIDFDPSTGECRGLLIEEQRTNLDTKYKLSDNSNPYYLIETPNATIAPDGTFTAVKAVPTTNNTPHRYEISHTVAAATTYTHSIYVKPAGYTGLSFFCFADSSGYVATNQSIMFDLSTGIASSVGSAILANSIQPVGNGWYRCSVTVTSNQATSGAYIAWQINNVSTTTYNGDGVSGIYFWGYQREVGNFLTSYIPPTITFTSRASSATYFDASGVLRTAPANGARYGYGYDSATGKWVSQGLVLEPAATNLFDSQGLLTSLTNATATVSSTLGLDGVTYAQRIQVSNNYVYRYFPSVLGGNATHTWSFFVKPVNNLFRFANGGTPGNFSYYFDFTPTTPTFSFSGTNFTNLGCTITPVGNSGWWRVTCTVNGTGTTGYMEAQWSYGGTGTADFYLWGIQCETGSVATSYIPTINSTVTRSADVSSSAATTRAAELAYLDKTNFSSWYNALSGTAYAEYTSLYSVQPAYSFQNSNGSTSNHWTLSSTSGQYSFFSTNNGNSNGNQNGTAGITAGIPTKVAVAVQAGNAAIAQSGNIAAAVTNFNTIPVVDRLVLTATYNLAGTNAYIKKLTYYPQRLSNTQLQALTV